MTLAAAVLALLAPLAAVAAPELRAERITAATAPELLIGGPDAIGGVGDWYLANDVVEVVVDDPGRAYGSLGHGGSLVDVGLRDRRGEDQFARLWPLLNLSQRVFPGYHEIRAERDAEAGWARLVVSSRGRLDSLPRGGLFADWTVPDPRDLEGVVMETEYAVFRGEPFVHITTTLYNESERAVPLFAYGDVWMRGGRSARSFVGNALAPDASPGFRHTSFDRDNLFANPEALTAFTHVSVPGVSGPPAIAYALVSPERARQGRLQYGVTGVHVNLANAFVGDPDWPELGLWRLALATFGQLEPGATWSYRRRLLVTGRADVASTTDLIFPLLGVSDGASGIEGSVEPEGVEAVIHVALAESGAPVTQITPRDGRYRAVLPPGRYRLRLLAPQRPPQEARVEVAPGRFSEVAPQRFAEPGWLLFDPAFADGGPGRLVVQGVDGTADPLFEPELLGFQLDGERVSSGRESSQLFFLGGPPDPGRVAIPPGRYRLTASRGLEWGAAQATVEVARAGDQVRVPPFALERAVSLPGRLAADLHVHGRASDDSAMPAAARFASFVAEGIDVMVLSDHDNLDALDEAVAGLGLEGRLRVIQGVEATSSAPSRAAPWTIGHSNAWPIPYRPTAHRHGAPPTGNRSLADLYAGLRAGHGARVVQLNHARDNEPDSLEPGAYLTHLGDAGRPFRPELPLSAEPNARLLATAADGRTRAIDFDAMELMNGRRARQHLRLRDDWYSLLRQGYTRTGTANSDSHGPDELAGNPRNYVRMEGDAWDPAAFDAAVRGGRLFGTNGPLLETFRVNGAGMGERVAADAGRVVVELAVAAAPWVPVDEVRLLQNGRVVRRWLPPAGDPVWRLRAREELALPADSFLTLEAGAPLDAEPAAWIASHPGLYTEVLAPGFVPAAFSNPVWVDADGDGRLDPPGLGSPP